MKIFLAAVFVLVGFQAQAKTVAVMGKVEIHFDLVKTVHDCFPASDGRPNPGPGNCGFYQDLNLNQTYTGYASFEGRFITSNWGSTWFYDSGIEGDGSETCRFGPLSWCALSYTGSQGGALNSFSNFAISYWPQTGFYKADFGWNLQAGTGFHTWEDDDYPFFARGRFEFSNVVVKSTLPMVPLPASAILLPAAIAALGAGRFLKKKNQA